MIKKIHPTKKRPRSPRQKKDGKYAVELGGICVELSEDKQKNLTRNYVAEQKIVLDICPKHTELADTGIDAKIEKLLAKTAQILRI